jgi:hypothetical protein
MNEDNVGSVNLGRHRAQCSVCAHPACQEMEEFWIEWGHPSDIVALYHVSRDAWHRHARAMGLYEKRAKNNLRALERMIERVTATPLSGSALVSAIMAHAKLVSSGQGAEQARGTKAKELFERMSKEEREAFARDGSLPDWFSKGERDNAG